MTKFYELDQAGRLHQLTAEGALTAEDAAALAKAAPLDEKVADALVENQVGQFTLPIGVARDLIVNGETFQVPMATEEPSVIAAASNGARLAGLNGGVTAIAAPHLVTAEIVVAGLSDPVASAKRLAERQEEITAIANAAHPSIVRRGGGLRGQVVSVIDQRFLKLALQVDPQQAMGANIVNTIAEAVAAKVATWLAKRPLVSILSNRTTQLTRATVSLAPTTLAKDPADGVELAKRIVALSELAAVDVDRAATHNKGIMNGIDAAVLASGNDTRAVETAVAVQAASSGSYQPLAKWREADGSLVGEIAVPLPVGVVGGAMSTLPMAKVVGRLGQYRDVATLQQVLASLGLVQNLAALRALVGPGIQAGHMKLRANALAIAAGATGDEIAQVAAQLPPKTQSLAEAQKLLQILRHKEDKA